ncbi:MAG: hypothetical protein L3J95_01750 [Thermoplasmata archaeon]|nr:hypothetical protein [Thermoplasmata archaeon]MCI4359137.1 hypothetical protein [Thermoplasmata archaeon]
MTESEVIDAVEEGLKARGFTSHYRVKDIGSHGPDLIMKSPSGVRLTIEAKGQGSSQPGTPRYGKEFLKSQKESSLGRALVQTTKLLSDGAAAGIALPGDATNRELIRERSRSLARLGIVVIFVSTDKGNHSIELAVGALPK